MGFQQQLINCIAWKVRVGTQSGRLAPRAATGSSNSYKPETSRSNILIWISFMCGQLRDQYYTNAGNTAAAVAKNPLLVPATPRSTSINDDVVIVDYQQHQVGFIL